MKASKYNNKKYYKKQKTRKHKKHKKYHKKHKKHHKNSHRKLKHNSKKRRYSRRKKVKGGKVFPIFYNQNQTLGNIYPLSKIGAPVGGSEIYQRAEPVYPAGQIKGGASNIPMTGEITNLFRTGVHSMSEVGRAALGDNSTHNPLPTEDHFNHNGGNGAKNSNIGMNYLDNALIASNSVTRNF